MSEFKTANITIIGDIQVTVPASLQYMTTFVLQEQKDWFEDEMNFIRSFIKPGMKVLDIGANYGCYALTMSKIIGDSGKLWAFEPTESTSACLGKSILTNKFTTLELVQAGLSDRCGEARLFTSPNSELNSLSSNDVAGDQYEAIRVLTLDHCQDRYQWDDLDFIKLDAEGEERNILRGGEETLSSLSPLVMFELKHGSHINIPLIEQFESIGYGSYRLLPGLNVLVPFDRNEPFDEYLLNLFACKQDKAQQLEQDGILVREKGRVSLSGDGVAQRHISQLIYGEPLNRWVHTAGDDKSCEYYDILNAYARSLSVAVNNADRVALLMYALEGVRSRLSKGEPRIECLSTFSRIAFDSGERAIGVKILTELISGYSRNPGVEINHWFFPACRRYDSIDPGGAMPAWLFSSIFEQWIVKHAYSAYFSGKASLPVFNLLNRMGFIDAHMQARFDLVRRCFVN